MPDEQALSFDPKQLQHPEVYKLLSGSIVPRPIAWVSSVDKNGESNLAPFSFFTVASRRPPTLAISIGEGVQDRIGTVKDTLANIRETEEFVINVVPEALSNAMHESSLHVSAEVDEFQTAQLTPAPSKMVSVPSVEEAPVCFELRLREILEIGTDHLILGEVLQVRIAEDIYIKDFKVDYEKWKPLARVAKGYASLTNYHTLPKNE